MRVLCAYAPFRNRLHGPWASMQVSLTEENRSADSFKSFGTLTSQNAVYCMIERCSYGLDPARCWAPAKKDGKGNPRKGVTLSPLPHAIIHLAFIVVVSF